MYALIDFALFYAFIDFALFYAFTDFASRCFSLTSAVQLHLGAWRCWVTKHCKTCSGLFLWRQCLVCYAVHVYLVHSVTPLFLNRHSTCRRGARRRCY